MPLDGQQLERGIQNFSQKIEKSDLTQHNNSRDYSRVQPHDKDNQDGMGHIHQEILHNYPLYRHFHFWTLLLNIYHSLAYVFNHIYVYVAKV